MKLGILSDSHGDIDRTLDAVRLLQKKGAEALIHCGDIGSELVLMELVTAQLPTHAVLGNVDLYDASIADFPTSTGVHVHGRCATLHLNKWHVAIIHGDDEKMLKHVITDGSYHYVFRGHTHVRSDERIGKTRVINPGAIYRAVPPSVALLDLEKDHLEFISLR